MTRARTYKRGCLTIYETKYSRTSLYRKDRKGKKRDDRLDIKVEMWAQKSVSEEELATAVCIFMAGIDTAHPSFPANIGYHEMDIVNGKEIWFSRSDEYGVNLEGYSRGLVIDEIKTRAENCGILEGSDLYSR